jgi:hypothetical protein
MNIPTTQIIYCAIALSCVSILWLSVEPHVISDQKTAPNGLVSISGKMSEIHSTNSVTTAKIRYECSQTIRWYMPYTASEQTAVHIQGFFLGDTLIVSKIEPIITDTNKTRFKT